ncbi:MAG: SEC-C metal-binding domain-containing protein [Spirochaetota bacterium]|nr:SEC-C metal-binding domain-containing protein [Spirochaetota bacterium]
MLNEHPEEIVFHPEICTNFCKGSCCDPWWGVIFYTLKLDERTLKYDNIKQELLKSIKTRADRIKERYVTSETISRKLFQDPIKYNITIENIKPDVKSLIISLRAMFAFQCLFLSDDKRCSIHPTILKSDIRPPHCEELGNPDARIGEKGFCRIVDTAIKTSYNEQDIILSVEEERNVSNKHFNEGVSNINEVVNKLFEQIQDFQRQKHNKNPAETGKKPSRNDICPCGSGLKYKKCHGK